MVRPELIERALQIVEDVLELHGEARRQLVEDRCAGDAELRREVQSLLKQEQASELEPE